MKKLIVSFICLLSFAGMAQNSSSGKSALTPLLGLYYNIKDALVNSDGATASAKAAEFLKTVNAIDVKTLPANEQKVFSPLKTKLIFDAEHISETKDVAHQRDHFSSFSTNMFSLAKAVKLTSENIYQMYCPMKKSNWLSNESVVKNPYYGKQMLNCGKVSETIK